MTETATALDPARAQAFGGHLMTVLSGGLLSLMTDIGHRTGLFAAAAASGWVTCEELSERTGMAYCWLASWVSSSPSTR